MALQDSDLLPLYRITDSSNRKISVADFSTFIASENPSVIISDTPPLGAVAGDLYWDTDTATMYIYYNDGNTAQWVPSVPTVTPITEIDGGIY